MTKLKLIVSQLSPQDYEALQLQLSGGGASKSSFLLQALREEKLNDRKIIRHLGMSTNAYYTLCSRLGHKIENHLLAQMETSRTALLRKVANLHEIVFRRSRTIAVTTLKKIEKELQDYDLSVELTIVYKYLKKLYAYGKEHFIYSQKYNQQITYMLAMEKSENLILDYYRSYGSYFFRQDGDNLVALRLYKKKLQELFSQHDSHRLYVHQAILTIFHRLYVEENAPESENASTVESTEHIFDKVYGYFKQYPEDPIYPHYVLLFDFLRLAYYHHYGIQRKVEQLYEYLEEEAPRLFSNYNSYTFPSHVLWIILSRHIRVHTTHELEEKNQTLFASYKPEKTDMPNYLNYVVYRTLCCYYAGQYRAATHWIQKVFNEYSLKAYPYAQVELKTLLALQYAALDDHTLFTQTINSLQRHIRLLGKEHVAHLVHFVRILKLSMQEHRKRQQERMRQLIKQIPEPAPNFFSPLRFIQFDEAFLERLSKVRVLEY